MIIGAIFLGLFGFLGIALLIYLVVLFAWCLIECVNDDSNENPLDEVNIFIRTKTNQKS